MRERFVGTKIIIADADPVARLGLEELFGSADDMQVVGACGNGEEALVAALKARPDLAVLDFDLPGGGGPGVCRLMKGLPEAPRVLVRAARDSAERLSSCVLAGANSCLHKGVGCEALLNAARRCAAGENVWDASAIGEVPGGHHDYALIRHRTAGLARLSPREAEVLELKLHRRTNAEIAEVLSMSLNTVKHHVTRIHKKLGQPIKELL